MAEGKEKYSDSVQDYLQKLEAIRPEFERNLEENHQKAGKEDKFFFYRGESDSSYNRENDPGYRLAPALFRKGEAGKDLYGKEAEKKLLESIAAPVMMNSGRTKRLLSAFCGRSIMACRHGCLM